jgi:hypothetical protein
MPMLAAIVEVAAMAAAAVAVIAISVLIPISAAILVYIFVASPFPTKRREVAMLFMKCILKESKRSDG